MFIQNFLQISHYFQILIILISHFSNFLFFINLSKNILKDLLSKCLWILPENFTNR